MSRFLSLFTYVQFGNQICSGSNGDFGTCMAKNECKIRGGMEIGSCASEYGTCCSILVKCGGVVKTNGSYFINEGYPDSYTRIGSCQVSLMKTSSSICQFRLDFEELTLMGPETQNHACINDQFIVTGGNPSVPPICGKNDGNHVYINVEEENNITPVILTIITSMDSSFERTWRIRITQILCNSAGKADQGCLQFYTGLTGQIKSFNFDLTDGRQLSNQDYTICVRTERNFCGIQYSQCTDNVNARNQSFTLSGNSNSLVQSMVGSTGNTNSCPNDYLIIPMASNINRINQGRANSVDRLCGGIFNTEISQVSSTVQSTVRPFILVFHTDNVEFPVDVNNKGFCLNFLQQPCTNRIQ